MTYYYWYSFFISEIFSVPYLIIYIAGIICSIIFWRKLATTSFLISLIAFSLFLTSHLTSIGFRFYIMIVLSNGGSPTQIGFIQGITSFSCTTLSVIAWILLLIALFGFRTDKH